MNFLLRTAMVFFGTLIAAGLVALGETAAIDLDSAATPDPTTLVADLIGF